jgi:AAA domain
MDSLLTHVIAWPTVLVSLLVFGFAPGAVLRVIVLAYLRDDPRRTELRGELLNVPRIERPFWVFEQLELALFEGLAGRLAALVDWKRDGRRRLLPGEPRREDAVSRYLDLLEGSVLALWDFESRKQGRQAVRYRRVSPAAGGHRLSGSVYWMTVDDYANLEPGARVELDEHPGLRGLVSAVSGCDVCIRFDTPVSHLTLPTQGSLWRSHDDRLCQMQRQAIARLREGFAVNPQLIRVLADRAFLPFSPYGSVAPRTPCLDRNQYEAVYRACQVQDFLLVTSPPGTGRTRTTSEIIDQCVRRGERVLVVGATSMGVDSLLSTLPQDITKVRVAKPNSLSASPSKLGMLNAVVVDPACDTDASPRIVAEQADVVAGTTVGITLSGITIGQVFDLLVIMEAEKVSLPSAIVPLVSARRAVLIGDPRQLPLFVDPDMHGWFRRLTGRPEQDLPVADMEALLTTSLFELLLAEAPSSNKVVLTAQYRMPGAVADFISHNFYDGMLTSPAGDLGGESVIRSPLPQPFTIVDTSCLPPWQREERRRGRSYVNRAEVDIISAIVTAEDRRGRDWAVVVPYAAQASLIREQLRKRLEPARTTGDLEVMVGTIDNFSGVEHDLVVVGCTRSNRSGSIGFLRELRRFNVAMTRARRQLVVVGDMQTLTSARDLPVRALMSAMLAHVQRRGEIVPADEITRRLR